MARIIYGALVTSIRGSIQGTTFQRNAYGYTVKGKPNIINPNSAKQNAAKRRFASANQAWRTLSGSDRANWNTYAATFPIPSRLNPSAYLSGLAAFTRYHGVTSQSNAATLANPSGPQGTCVVNSLTIENGGIGATLELNATTTEGPWEVYIYLTRPLQATQNFVKSWQRYIGSAADSLWPTIGISVQYFVTFGQFPQPGDRVGTILALVNTTNGQIFFTSPEVLTVLP